MGRVSQQAINDMQDGTICKAVSGDYVIYKRSWLMEHIEQEVILWKSARDFNKSVVHRKKLLEKIKGEMRNGKETQNRIKVQ